MKSYILNLENYDGASGLITYNPTTYGAQKKIIIKTVKNGKFIEIKN